MHIKLKSYRPIVFNRFIKLAKWRSQGNRHGNKAAASLIYIDLFGDTLDHDCNIFAYRAMHISAASFKWWITGPRLHSILYMTAYKIMDLASFIRWFTGQFVGFIVFGC